MVYLESSQVAAWLRPYFLHTLVTNIDFDFFIEYLDIADVQFFS